MINDINVLNVSKKQTCTTFIYPEQNPIIMTAWRESLSPEIKEELEKLLSLTAEQEKAYNRAKHPASAQLWCALALLAKENQTLNKEIQNLQQLFLILKQKAKYLEEALKEFSPKQKKEDSGEDPKEELKKFLKRI